MRDFIDMDVNKIAVLGIIILGVVGAWFTKDAISVTDSIKILGGMVSGAALVKLSSTS